MFLVTVTVTVTLLRVVVSEMTYTVSSGTLNSTIPYHTTTVYGRAGAFDTFLGGRDEIRRKLSGNCTLYRVRFCLHLHLMFTEAWSWWSCDQREGS